MSDARWFDVEADLDAALMHFGKALALRQAGGFDGAGLERYRAEMALMHAMQSAHTSAEAALVRILRLLDEEKPEGDDWHAKLIDRLARPIPGDHARPALLGAQESVDLHETRSFRHRVIHSYGKFELRRAEPAIEAAARLVNSLPAALAVFKSTVDPEP